MNTPIKVEIVKSDIQKGRTIEHIHEFDEYEIAKQFVIDFNSVNDPDSISDIFSFARMIDRRVNIH